MANGANGPVVFAYDGSDLAKGAIAEAGRQLSPSRQALVLTVWQPYSVGFVTPRQLKLDAAAVDEVRAAAEQTAVQGAGLAQEAGFNARSMAKEAAPAWRGIVEAADEQDSSLVVLGSHGRTRLADVLIGSVAEAVVAHSRRPVLVVHPRT
ncbi:MAG TPA: universal stress protein [Acidimicrobiales bacterium]|nr:universal stress protein [Acidimicrobiales bacterium]